MARAPPFFPPLTPEEAVGSKRASHSRPLINGGGCSRCPETGGAPFQSRGLFASIGWPRRRIFCVALSGRRERTNRNSKQGARGEKVAVPANDHGSRLPSVDQHPHHKPYAPSSDPPSSREETSVPAAVGCRPTLPRAVPEPRPSTHPHPWSRPSRCPSLCALPCPSPLPGLRQRRSLLSTATGTVQAATESGSESAPGRRARTQRARSARCARVGMGRPG